MAVKKGKRCTRVSLQKTQQTQKSKDHQKHEATVTPKNDKAVIIAQEIKFARLLANTDKRVRDKVLKNLKKWLTARSKTSFAFTETDFLRLWKGLFYCMWMSDKPLIQEDLAESLSKIVHCFDSKDVILLYTTSALKTLGIEWFGIDQYRLDKFAMLVRRIIRQTFQICKDNSWDMEWMKDVSEIIEGLLLNPKICLGFGMHLTELYLEELSKISNGDIPENVVTELVKPFAVYLSKMNDERQIKHIMKHIFRYLILQSDVGINYMEKFEAWKKAGFPAGSIDAMEKIELSDEELEEENEASEEEKGSKDQGKCNTKRQLDPRAGRVDVELPQIPFNAAQIAKLLTEYKFHPLSTTKSRRQILHLIREFTELSEGEMPLGIKEIDVPITSKKDTDSKSAAIRLFQFEKELYSDNTQKKRKRKKNGELTTENERHEEGIAQNSFDNTDEVVEDQEIHEHMKKKRKTKKDSNTDVNLIQSKSQESNTIASTSEKKKCKTQKKVHSNLETELQSNSSKIKKGTLRLTNNNTRSKKKLKRDGILAANASSTIPPVKRKKSAKLKVSGKWDVSDNVASLVVNDADSHSETNKKPLMEDSVKKNNIFDNQTMWLAPVLKKLGDRKVKQQNSSKKQIMLNNSTSSKKRVKIVLQRNTAQHTSEYIQQIRQSPAIPFDANRKPLAGVLKASPIPSPINPFYKKAIK